MHHMTAHPAALTAAHDEVASAASAPTAPVRFTRAGLLTVLVCWLLVVFDGYDLIVYGTVQTTLIETTGWGLTKATAGTVGSVAFAGMLVGAILAGRLSDSLGRKTRGARLRGGVLGVHHRLRRRTERTRLRHPAGSWPASASAVSSRPRTRWPPVSSRPAGGPWWPP